MAGWLLFIICGLTFVMLSLLVVYMRHMFTVRNESEYRDIVEYQTMLVAAMLAAQPNLLPTVGKLRYFPDQSGFFIVLDYTGKILVHGDYDGKLDSEQHLPFIIPVNDMVETAKNGGGYIRYNYKGHIYQSFVYGYPNSPYIVTSGLFSDLHHVTKRKEWKRVDRTVIRNPLCNNKRQLMKK